SRSGGYCKGVKNRRFHNGYSWFGDIVLVFCIRNILMGFAVIGVLSACENVLKITGGSTETQAVTFAAGKGAFERNILAHHPLQAARKTAQAQAFAVTELRAGRATQIGLSGTAGVAAGDDQDGAKTALSVTASASRLLADGGRLQAQIDAALIAQDQAVLEYALQGNTFLTDLLNAVVTIRSANATISTIDRNLAQYRKREPQINAAARQGILTNSDLIEIRTVKSQIETQRLESVLALKTAQTQLQSFLSASAQRTLTARFARASNASLKRAPNFVAQAQGLGADQFGAKARTAALANKSTLQTVAQVTLPAADETGIDVFAGVQWNWTVSDGGARAAAARRLELQREAAELVQENTVRTTKLAGQSLRVARQIGDDRRQALQDRIALSKSRLAEFETLLRAGRADVASIARELLAGAEAEIGLTALASELSLQQISTFSAKGAACALVQMCDVFELRTQK
ncbi:MAG: TolC family protein, partial [Planktomarina sp.]